ncbi:glycosyltransferase family 39 protein [Luteimonas kalidii]|uniref:Glycosyltransferase family 39 protein n=1 Tax=Luteimonas kalidii TaxID=3042025 RepID=A0ABT6JVP2_9GAMM|nr:glycosyltransferase family 39 protein [Luteimonas kalidii]MDH5834742.1 glycosyltransferase family 39 protein [Luteimonas kalidii]
MREHNRARAAFVTLWTVTVLVKLAVAARLPLFVDEAFYWQEGRHLAWAYSDLPGLTAWTIRLGGELFGDGVLAARALFLLVSVMLPWIVVALTRRECDAHAGWVAGCGALVLPLFAMLGVMALPDVLLALATLLALDALAKMLRRVSHANAAQLALALAIGALSHYRFIAALGAGFLALLLMPQGRALLRDPRVIIALTFGAAAWMPLLAWNVENAEAGLRFQLVDRHPWSLHLEGITFLGIQAVLVTPLLFVALLVAAWRFRRNERPALRLLALSGGIVVAGFFVLGFFADTERVSFHWPLPGYVALLPLLPAVLAGWARWLRIATWALAGCGLVAVLGYYVAVSTPQVRAQLAEFKWYPSNFAGWDRLAGEVDRLRATLPPGTRLVADNFKIGAELGFALGETDIPVLDHPLNRAHGRAPQLKLWGLEVVSREALAGAPLLLVVGASDVPYRELLQRYHALCELLGPLPAPRVLNIDHGRQRFVLLAWPQGVAADPGEDSCRTPAMAWIDTPETGGRVAGGFEVAGWAFKDGVGLSRVEILVDGRVVGEARYGLPSPGTAQFWRISNDPGHPDVGFRAQVDGAALAPGRRWLGLRLHGRDGSVEDWIETPIRVAPAPRTDALRE